MRFLGLSIQRFGEDLSDSSIRQEQFCSLIFIWNLIHNPERHKDLLCHRTIKMLDVLAGVCMASEPPWYNGSSSFLLSSCFTLSYNLHPFLPNCQFSHVTNALTSSLYPPAICPFPLSLSYSLHYQRADLSFLLSCNLHLFPRPHQIPHATANVLTSHNLRCISCNLYSFFLQGEGGEEAEEKLHCYRCVQG